MENDKHIDESWKDTVAKEKTSPGVEGESCGCGHDHEHGHEELEASFLNYIMSMGYQAMIFLGEVPNPVTGSTEKNLRQAKFLIDTLGLLRDKTKGNLTPEEDNLLNSSVYELQMRFVEVSKKEN